MKILQAMWDYPLTEENSITGGMIKNPYYLIKGLRERGHEVDVITTSRDEKSYIKNFEKSTYENVWYSKDGKSKGVLRYRDRINEINKVFEKIKAKKYDIIHCHMPSLLVRPSNFLSNEKLIITAHGTHWPEFKANFSIFNFKNIPEYLNAFIQFNFEKKLYSQADYVVSVSKFQNKELIGDYQISSDKISNIHNGIPHEHYLKPLRKEKKINKLLFVGRFVPKKGIMLLLSVFVQMLKKYNSLSLTLVGGTGWVSEPFILEQMQEFISENRINDKVEIKLDVKESELPEVYSKHDLLIVPSEGYESLPTVILESIMSKTPVIASRSFGNKEVLSEEYMFEEGNAIDLFDNLESMLSGKNSYTNFNKKHSWVIEEYSANKFVTRHIEVYEKSINS